MVSRKQLLVVVIAVVALLCGSAQAFGPPGDPAFYEGIWLFKISKKCNMSETGSPVGFPLEQIYGVLVTTVDSGNVAYDKYFYPTLDDARNDTNGIGYGYLSFGPEFFFLPAASSKVKGLISKSNPAQANVAVNGVVSYVFTQISERYVTNSKFTGYCVDLAQGWLKTSVLLNNNQGLSKLTGWSVEECFPLLPNGDTVLQVDENKFLVCNDDFVADWKEGLPAWASPTVQ